VEYVELVIELVVVELEAVEEVVLMVAVLLVLVDDELVVVAVELVVKCFSKIVSSVGSNFTSPSTKVTSDS
jgi:hypothetical protein